MQKKSQKAKSARLQAGQQYHRTNINMFEGIPSQLMLGGQEEIFISRTERKFMQFFYLQVKG